MPPLKDGELKAAAREAASGPRSIASPPDAHRDAGLRAAQTAEVAVIGDPATPRHVTPNVISHDDDRDAGQDERRGPHEIEVEPRATYNVNRGALVDHDGQHGRDE
jgi:hypothetical protein